MKLQPYIFRYINSVVATALALTLFAFATLFFVSDKSNATQDSLKKKNGELLLNFAHSSDPEKAPFFSLEKNTSEFLLPDLRKTLVFYGTNERPDTSEKEITLFFGIKPSNKIHAMPANKKAYLEHAFKKGKNSWQFLEQTKSPIWVVPQADDEATASLQLAMKDASGNIVQEPKEYASFLLKRLPLTFHQRKSDPWQIEDFTLDKTLLTSQGAIWYGNDLFLSEYGGPEYSEAKGAEHILFQSAEHTHSLFVAEGDALTFSSGRWQKTAIGKSSRGKSLLIAKEVNNGALIFDLWHPEGTYNLEVTLNKTATNIITEQTVKAAIVGARSKKDWIINFSGTRKLVRLHDWILFHDETCETLDTLEKVDNFLSGEVKGKLLVIDSVEKRAGDNALIGKLFDETRSQMLKITIGREKIEQKSSDEYTTESYDDDDDYDDFEEDDYYDYFDDFDDYFDE